MPRSKILSIEVENFKSYAGTTIIGPMTDFTAIIGPNGSGKSNVMDAISFVLGVRANQLRGSNLQELIHVSNDGVRADRASVTLMFSSTDSSGKTIEYKLSRVVRGDGSSQYRINGAVVSYEKYDELLQSLGIFVKTKNFLVFQGDVESVSTKNSKELTAIIEHVSGSGAYKEEYETSKAALDKATESTVFAYQQKRGIRAEKVQCEEQKKEAERWQQLENIRKEKTAIQLLFELWVIEDENNQLEEEIRKLNDKIADISNRQVTAQETIKEKKRKLASVHKTKVKKERAAQELEDDMRALKPTVIKAQKGVEHHKTKLSNHKRMLARAESEYADQKKLLAQIQSQINRIKSEREEFENEVKALGEGITMEQSQLKEYHRLKEIVSAKVAQELEQQSKLQRADRSDQDELRALHRKDTEIHSRQDQLRDQEMKLKEHLRVIGDKQSRATKAVEDLNKELNRLRSERANTDEAESKIQAQIDEIMEQMRDMRVDMEENERETKKTQAVASLMRLFHGVKGQLSDLCEPVHRRYQSALAVALGKNFDAIVVDTHATAVECVRYLKEQKISQMTFLPLDSIRPTPVNENVKNYVAGMNSSSSSPKKGHEVALVTDIIKFDETIEKAVLFSCSNVVVCDSVDTARKVSFANSINTRIKTVTLDGAVIEKTGLMSGGATGQDRRASKWDEKDAEKLKQRKATLTSELSDIRSHKFDAQQENHIVEEIRANESRIVQLNNDAKLTSDKLEHNLEEMRRLDNERLTINPQKLKIEASINDRSAVLSKLQATISSTEDTAFVDLCKAIGVANIREYEEGRMKRITAISERRGAIDQELSRAESALSYETSRDKSRSVSELQAQISKLQTELKNTESDAQQSSAKADALAAQIKSAHDEVAALTTEEKDMETEISALTNAHSAALKNGGQLQSELSAAETQFQSNRHKRARLLSRGRMDRIPVPLTDGRSLDSADSVAEDGIVKFDALPRNMHLPNMSEETKAKIRKQIEDELKNVNADLDKIAPNLRAVDRLEHVTERWKSVTDVHDKARTELKEAENRFKTAKKNRFEAFQKAFDHISRNIDDIYKRLTRSDQHPLGGRAYLTLENPEEPYLEGVRFNAMPPLKRFRDMDQLSGGEKTVAALALLFAIHSHQPSPFFILDEIDAALDNANVKKVARYIKHRDDVQIIIISLKELLYTEANSLVGICRDPETMQSKTFTLDLTRYAN